MLDGTAHTLKKDKQRLKQAWIKSRHSVDFENFQISRQLFHDYVFQKKLEYINGTIQDCGRDSAKLYQQIFTLLEMVKQNPLPPGKSDSNLVENKVDCCFRAFSAVDTETVQKIINSSKPTTCRLDPLLTTIVKKRLDTLGPVITKIVNQSLLNHWNLL